MQSQKVFLLHLAFVLLFHVSTAQPQESLDTLRERLKKADRDFSALSLQKGPAVAFTTFMTDDASLLHAGSPPVTGKNKIRAHYADFPEDGSLTWEPIEADCSASGDLGYTMGKYESTTRNPDGTQRTRGGTYMTLWKKQDDGTLKAIADLGSPSATPTDSVGRTIVRTPIGSEVSRLGDFGLSYGTYVLKLHTEKDNLTKSYWSYIQVWQKSVRRARIVIKDVSCPIPAPQKR
jgi:ketosteroid isomerase-like protein